jgi:hypothetical protein
MKIYFIIILLNFFELAFAAFKKYVYDINYAEEYIVNVKEFGSHIPLDTYLQFLVEIEKDYDIYTKLSFLYNDNYGYEIRFCKYSSKPSHEQIKEDEENGKCKPDINASDEKYYEGNYKRILYYLSVGGEIKYISVNVLFRYYATTYFSVYVGPQEKKYKLYDISYKNEFKLNYEDLNVGRNNFLFRLKIESEDNGIIQLKVNKDAYPDREIFVSLSGYESMPERVKQLEENEIVRKDLLLESKSSNANYSIYEFLFEKIENAKYLGIRVLIDKNITFFSVYVGNKYDESEKEGQEEKKDDNSEEEETGENKKSNDKEKSHNYSTEIPLSIPIIVLIGILYTIIILLIFYFVFRKCTNNKGNKPLSEEINKDFSIQSVL